jgi:uncharacterized membrane protein
VKQPTTASLDDTAPGYPPPARSERHWPPQLIVAIAIALQLLLPDRLSVGKHWFVPSIEAVMLISLIIASPQVIQDRHRTRRRIAVTLSALASTANGISLALLCHLLFEANPLGGHALIISGALIWLTNVMVFSLWYWEMDRGGPGFRAAGEDGPPDFLFPQMSEPELCRDWRPVFFDYLYVSLTNAMAISPTDTMPLSLMAKLIMGVQSLISLVTIGLVISRAVNIL